MMSLLLIRSVNGTQLIKLTHCSIMMMNHRQEFHIHLRFEMSIKRISLMESLVFCNLILCVQFLSEIVSDNAS